jgi:hypothetical protein
MPPGNPQARLWGLPAAARHACELPSGELRLLGIGKLNNETRLTVAEDDFRAAYH